MKQVVNARIIAESLVHPKLVSCHIFVVVVWVAFRFGVLQKLVVSIAHRTKTLRGAPNRRVLLRFSHQCLRKKPWTDKKNPAIIASSEVTMTFPFFSRSTQISNPSRSTVIDFEPLLDASEAAALLRMHPNTLRMKARLGEIPGRHIGKYWRFRVSDLNDWVRHQERRGDGTTNPLEAYVAHPYDASAGQEVPQSSSRQIGAFPQPRLR